ncbi:MAG: glycosyltransferase family 2 protein [Bacteroidales bacterium]|nr:glycosyltransferase family 2 protein [Bacteroidales bacterium]
MNACSYINVIIPVYNEEKYIFKTIDETTNVLNDLCLQYKVLVVNDGSVDKTTDEINRYILLNKNDNIIVINNQNNRGKGYSIREGLKHVNQGIIIIQDSDLEYSPEDYPRLIDPIIKKKADVVYGSRFKGSEPKRVLYFTHLLANKYLTTLSNIFTGLNLSDMETCYKVFKYDVIKKIELKENRFGFEPEITSKLSKVKDIRIFEVGISYNGRRYSDGKKIKFRDALWTFLCILKYH